MPPRFRTSILFAFVLLFLYLVFPFGRNDAPYDNGSHVVDILKDNGGIYHDERPQPPPPVVHTKEKEKQLPSSTISTAPTSSEVKTSSAVPETTSTSASSVSSVKSAAQENSSTATSSAAPETPSPAAEDGVKFQEQFNKEYEALELKESSGKIYGNTLKNLESAGNHAGFAAAALSKTDSWTPYNDAPPLTYNPYPEYNNKAWNASNQGTYVPCPGPDGEVKEVKVFSGHPHDFEEPGIGSFIALEIDSNLCFERESRLGAYGYQEEGGLATTKLSRDKKPTDWDAVNWGQLQKFCYEKNVGRYSVVETMPRVNNGGAANGTVAWPNGTVKAREMDADDHIEDESEARKHGLHGMPKFTVTAKSRTAVLLRAFSGKNYTENDKQNIRSLVTELSLRSGGEYQVYLLVQIKEDLPIWTDAKVHEKAVHDNVPKEFWDMTILWNDDSMKEWYPKIPEKVNNVHQSQWLSVQKFAQEHPQFDFYWNWELDSRYTGHHYNLLEKLATFAQAQPRKYLWERNERYYIPSFHGHYESKFRRAVEEASGTETIWRAPPVTGVTPVGSGPPVVDPREGTYEWGVGEEADYISLAPIFDPVGTTWPGRDDVWGYDGPEKTPRRASIGTQSRCSKKLLNAMHEENKNGNHVSSEMTPQTVALLHGLKAVYAPIPMFFDRAWEGAQLNKWFNPGPKGVSGSTAESPFSWERETRFEGSTWYYRAIPPMRLYNNWMGWEDSGVGGAEWEKNHGRTCLPPILLHPIKDVVKPPPGHRSKSDLPYSKP